MIRDTIRRLLLKVMPFVISLIFTSVIFFILFNYHPAVGNVTTEVTRIWI